MDTTVTMLLVMLVVTVWNEQLSLFVDVGRRDDPGMFLLLHFVPHDSLLSDTVERRPICSFQMDLLVSMTTGRGHILVLRCCDVTWAFSHVTFVEDP